MKKVMDILATACLLAAAVFFLFLAGGNFLKMMSGAELLKEEESFAEAEGKYILYEAAYPVGSYEEEYYSGDADRVSKFGFVLYDEARQAFLYVTINQEDSGGLKNLLNNRKYSMETLEQYHLSIDPVTLEGSLVKMDESRVRHAETALKDRRTEDETLAAVWDTLAATQKDWYMIEAGIIGGMETKDIWFCTLAAIVSLLIFAVRLVTMITGDSKQEVPSGTFSSRYEQFFFLERERIRQWCEYVRYRNDKSYYLCVIVTTIILAAIGLLTGYPAGEILVRHVPLGLLFGETVAVFCWLSAKKRMNWKNIMKKIRRNLEKEFPSAGQQDEFAQDYLDCSKEWGYEGKGKDSMTFGCLGNRYWTLISGLGNVTIIQTDKVSRVSTYVDTERVAYGKYRGSVTSYTAKFFMKDEKGMVYETIYLFPTESAMGDFARLLKKRVDGKIDVVEEGVKA